VHQEFQEVLEEESGALYPAVVDSGGSGNTPPTSPPQGNNGGLGDLVLLLELFMLWQEVEVLVQEL
jgi:hypothetical protein